MAQAQKPAVTQKDMQILQRMNNEVNAITRRVAELEQQRDEHNLVIKTLSKLENERKCYRMVGGVLVQRSVGEVLPAVTQHREALDKQMGVLQADRQERYKQMSEFARERGLLTQNIKDEEKTEKPAAAEKKTAGLLV